MKNLCFLLALHNVEGLGTKRLKSLLDFYEDPKVIWEENPRDLKQLSIPEPVIEKIKIAKRSIDPESYFEKIQKSGIKVLTFFDDEYPENLKQIYDPPIILYFKGEILPQYSRIIAVVGTRKVTGYGKAVTEKLVSDLVDCGFVITSGLAKGVDTIAHKTTVNKSGTTLAVLGGGLNRLFPPENYHLAEKIASGFGALMSEYPPEYPSLAGNFPARNRIISGLSQAILVTEAAKDSGSLITAHLALEQGKDVFAVPGPITSNLSSGPASLIKNGAKLVTSVEDILEELGVEQVQSSTLKIKSLENLSEFEKKVLQILEQEQKHVDEICRELKKVSSEVSGILVKMEILGIVKNLGGGVYVSIK